MKNLIIRVLSLIAVFSLIFIGACRGDDSSAGETDNNILGVIDTQDEETAELPEGKGEPTSEFVPMIYGDEDGFFLRINAPEQPEVIVKTDTILIAGETSVDAAISIGDEFVDVNLDGTFEKVVKLEEDITFIEVVASIIDGQQYNQVITVIYSQ